MAISERSLTAVDNLADGNCGYYAYSLSLMYYLKNLPAEHRAAQVDGLWQFLGLNEGATRSLTAILNSAHPFSELQRIQIQKILGPATRQKTASIMIEEIKSAIINPHSFSNTAFYAAISFQFREELKRQIDLPAQTNEEDFTQAEIYRVKGLRARIRNFVDSYSSLNHQQLKTDEHYFDQITLDTVIDFFTRNHHQELDNYLKHLQMDKRWASDEELTTLHEAMTYRSLQASFRFTNVSGHQTTPTETITLSNRGNCHWISMIPSQWLRATSNGAKQNKKFSRAEKKLNRLILQLLDGNVAFDRFYNQLEKLVDDFTSINKALPSDALYELINDVLSEKSNQPLPQQVKKLSRFNRFLGDVERFDYFIQPALGAEAFNVCLALQKQLEPQLWKNDFNLNEPKSLIEKSGLLDISKAWLTAYIENITQDDIMPPHQFSFITLFQNFDAEVRKSTGHATIEQRAGIKQLLRAIEIQTYHLVKNCYGQEANLQHMFLLQFQKKCDQLFADYASNPNQSKFIQAIQKHVHRFVNAITTFFKNEPYFSRRAQIDNMQRNISFFKQSIHKEIENIGKLQNKPTK